MADDVFVLQCEHRFKVAIVVRSNVALSESDGFRTRQRPAGISRFALRARLNCFRHASTEIR